MEQHNNERQPLSVAIITFNEEQLIRSTLESVSWADEIVIVDSFSTDHTVNICREYTERVYRIAWQGHVRQKQTATDSTSHRWVLSLDADERVSPALAAEIQHALREQPAYRGYYMPRRTWYAGAWINHCGWYPDCKLRLFDKTVGRWTGVDPHDRVEVDGPTAYFRHDLHHYSYQNIAHHVQTLNNYSSIAAAHKPLRSVSGAEIFGRTVLTFLKKYLLKQGFRDGTRGLIVCLLSALTVTLKYAKLWERQLDRPESPPE
jgi:glycosyltransferase involved in cell wall biosynthesis